MGKYTVDYYTYVRRQESVNVTANSIEEAIEKAEHGIIDERKYGPKIEVLSEKELDVQDYKARRVESE